MGSQSLVAPGKGEASTSVESAADLDPEIALHLRRLSKREAVTKLKALQVWLRRIPEQCIACYSICSV